MVKDGFRLRRQHFSWFFFCRFREIEKGKYANSDSFAHYEVIIEKRDVLLLSDHRLMYCVKNDIFGGWQVKQNENSIEDWKN